jgi:hypothetical protein
MRARGHSLSRIRTYISRIHTYTPAQVRTLSHTRTNTRTQQITHTDTHCQLSFCGGPSICEHNRQRRRCRATWCQRLPSCPRVTQCDTRPDGEWGNSTSCLCWPREPSVSATQQACCTHRPTFIGCLSINTLPLPPPKHVSHSFA